jgi:hypothetical protein
MALPPEYQPVLSAVKGNYIRITCRLSTFIFLTSVRIYYATSKDEPNFKIYIDCDNVNSF